jgi:hypothetical protein
MENVNKVTPEHRRRLAVVYVRQSSLQQVQDHRESTARQYDLQRRARALGWPPEQILVIDEDLASPALPPSSAPGSSIWSRRSGWGASGWSWGWRSRA